MKLSISLSKNGKNYYYIARDGSGVVRIRESSMESMHEAIKNYRLPKDEDLEPNQNGLEETVTLEENTAKKEAEQITETTPSSTPSETKEFLQSETKEIIETKRKSSGKKTFWDKLK